MRVAVIGASDNRSKFGNKAVRSYQANGHDVVPVHPSLKDIEGLTAYSSIRDVPPPVDRVLLYVPPAVGITLLDDIAAVGVGEIFVNPGAGSPELFARGKELRLNLIDDCAIVAIGDNPRNYR